MRLNLSIHAVLMPLLLNAGNVASANHRCDPDGEGSDCFPKDKNTNDKHATHQCSIYLAPSSIPNAGMGVFTVRKIEKGQRLLPYPDSPLIPICDEDDNGLPSDGMVWNYNDYYWDSMGMAHHECNTMSESVMTFGSSCNYHTYFKNVSPLLGPYEDDILDRFVSPGAGAISYHSGHPFVATEDILPGNEFFADYGEDWLDGRAGTFADEVPRSKDFSKAAELFQIVRQSVEENGVPVSDVLLKVQKAVMSSLNFAPAKLLPDTKLDYERFWNQSDVDKNPPARLMAERTINRRSKEWIKENGICLDNIRPGKSKIPDAGRGAIAKGYIPQGEIISPAPLLVVADKETLDMITLAERTAGKTADKKQILINYCFSHNNSQLALCPQSNMILMNHCSTRDLANEYCGSEGPNARIQWASGWDPHTEDWLKLTLNDVISKVTGGSRGLSLEIVATRDISPGEEVTFDYGENWEKAWDHHVKHWDPPIDDGTYIPVRKMAERKDFRTVDELKENPYPDNIELLCYYHLDGYDDNQGFEEVQDEDGIYAEKFSGSTMKPDNSEEELGLSQKYPCEIIERIVECNDGEDGCAEKYTVRVYNEDEGTRYIMTDYPGGASFAFATKKYKSDLHLSGAFRHFMEIDDTIFPDQWKTI